MDDGSRSIRDKLKRSFRLNSFIKAKQEEVERLRGILESNTNAVSEKVDSSYNPDKTVSILARVLDLEKIIGNEIEELLILKREIREAIERVANDDLRLLLSLRYLNFKKWEEIALEMNYSWRHVLRLHGEALEEIGKMEK